MAIAPPQYGYRCRTAARLSLAVAAGFALASQAIHAAELNDTGQTTCYRDGQTSTCAGGQDGRFGRDAAAMAAALPKTGAGAGGFDFTKIANDGSDLPDGALLGSGPGQWACTRDNVTGLTWEVKTPAASDLRYSGHLYTWYSTAAANGGNAGSVGSNSCNGTLGGAFSNQCNTSNYRIAVNGTVLCGYSNWRLPTPEELLSVVNFAIGNPAIDTGYFPNTPAFFFWTGTNLAPDPNRAWGIYFNNGNLGYLDKSGGHSVRLVRGAP